MEAYNGTFELVDPRVVVIDHRYQREMRPALVAAIASDPRWELFGVPVLFKRESKGVFYCADGQQRIEGIKRSQNPPKLIPSVWFPVRGVDEEAAVFVQINEFRIALSALQKHKGKIVAKDPATLSIEKTVETAGLSIGKGDEDGKTVMAVAALYNIYNRIGEEGLLQTLVVCRDAWEGDSTALNSQMLRAVADVIEELDSNYERSRLTKALSRTSPHQLIRKAEELRFNMGGSKQTNVRRAIKTLAKV